jgi:hypothetical protein
MLLLVFTHKVQHVLSEFLSITSLILLIDYIRHTLLSKELRYSLIFAFIGSRCNRCHFGRLHIYLGMQEVFHELVVVAHFDELLDPALVVVEDAVELRN